MFGLKPPKTAPPGPPTRAGWDKGTDQCGNCRFSMELPEEPTTHGIVCRRFPPCWVSFGIGPTGAPRGQSVYPGVVPDFWCGEYQRRSS